MGTAQPTSAKALVDVSLHSAPPFAWSFEETKAFSFRVVNHGLPELADPLRLAGLRYTADIFLGDRMIRRVALRRLPEVVPVGESRVFEADLGLTVFEGEFELRFGLERDGGDCAATVIPVVTRPAVIRVKNQIMEAFVELINACNFRCTFCPQATLQRKQRQMDFDLATKVVRDLADYGYKHPIRAHLLGEPLLYKRFFDFVEMAHGFGQRVLLVTNGSRFDDDTIDAIFRCGLDEILISLNTPREEIYDAQRGSRMSFTRYMSGIRRVVEELARRGAPPRTIIQVLYDEEKREDPEEIALANRLVAEWAGVVREIRGDAALEVDPVDHFESSPFTMVPVCDGLELQFTPYHSWGEGKPGSRHFCSFPWRQLAILVDGQATACCVDAEGEIHLGNAREQTIEEIWNGPALNRMREAFWNDMKAVEARCMRCPIHHGDIASTYRY